MTGIRSRRESVVQPPHFHCSCTYRYFSFEERLNGAIIGYNCGATCIRSCTAALLPEGDQMLCGVHESKDIASGWSP